MDKVQRDAVLISLIDGLRAKGSWCGETHVQKAVYVLKELAGLDLEFDFILYKHGPYSFELTEQLTSLRADGLLKQIPQCPYGPMLVTTEDGQRCKERHSRTLAEHAKAVKFVVSLVGPKGVTDLECLATALYVTREQDEHSTVEARANRITELKPHVCADSAVQAVSTIDEWRTRASDLA